MTTFEMRNTLKNEYVSQNWHKKVDKMSERQVFAVYNSIKDKKIRKNLDKEKKS